MHRNTMLKEERSGGDFFDAPIRSFFGSSFHPFAMMQNAMREMSHQFNQLEREMNNFYNSAESGFSRTGGSDALVPAFKQEIVSEEDKNKYKLNVYLGQNFSPENIKVTQKDRVLMIEAKSEQTSEDGHSRVYQEMSRKFTLPETVDMKELKSSLQNGILKIEALVPALPEPPKPIEIPVQILE